MSLDPLFERLNEVFETKKALEKLREAAPTDSSRAALDDLIAIAQRSIEEMLAALKGLRALTPLAKDDLSKLQLTDYNLDVTKVQKERRGNAVAKARAGNHPVSQAIVASKWKNQGNYAKRRLHLAQPTLSQYISGKNECPPEVADKVREDFGLGDGVWKRPPKR